MNKTEVQLFDNEYKTRCDTFSCGESAESMVGRPDAPLSTAMNLCATCTEQLVRSVVEKYNLHEKAVHGARTEAVESKEPFSAIDWDAVEQQHKNAVFAVAGAPAELLRLADEDIKRQELEATFTGEADFVKATMTGLDNIEPEVDNETEDEPEVTLEDILEGVRSHAELDAIAKELGVKGLPTRDEKKLNERKEYILNYEFPEEK